MRSSKGEVKTNLQVQNTATVTEITYGSILQGMTMQCSPQVFPKGYSACSPSKLLNKSVITSSHFATKGLHMKLHPDIRHTFHTKEGEYSSYVSCSLICWARTGYTKMSTYLIVFPGLNWLQRAYPVLHFFSVLSTQYQPPKWSDYLEKITHSD